ncbi:hypothetical protein [Belnapia rosea]|uniref:Uncharacterized protein n=1 Tax=Belnapia rosea TaxID=938405 RepID=A0A1G6YVU7_9PROT|nr:hypothetical protein [Belnapia rosea]SDD94183.1 hypothetical protein SAMN04487779_101517 [Belnapia rosea]
MSTTLHAWALVEEVAIGAVKTDPAAREHLFGPELQKLACRGAREQSLRGVPSQMAATPKAYA